MLIIGLKSSKTGSQSQSSEGETFGPKHSVTCTDPKHSMLPHGAISPTSRATETPGGDTWPLVKANPGRSVSQEPTLTGEN